MRGFFSIGVEGISKPQNLGNLVRSAHAFGASYFFTIAPALNVREVRSSDTSDAFEHLPFYEYESLETFRLPAKCALVGVELLPESVDLPSFKHPLRAAYVLGRELGSISPELQARCDHIVKIPMKFCVNVGVAGALVMYDRLISMGKFAPRPVMTGGKSEFCPPEK